MQTEKLLKIKNDEILKEESKKLIWTISNVFRGYSDWTLLKIYKTLFTLYIVNEYRQLSLDDYKQNIDEILDTILILNNKSTLKEPLKEFVNFHALYKIINDYHLVYNMKYDSETFIYALLFDETFSDNIMPECQSPHSLIRLGQELLNINKDSNILDLCSGFGNFIQDTILKYDFASISGVEVNHDVFDISLIKSFFYDKDVILERKNALVYCPDEKYDCIFTNFPFGLSIFDNKYPERYYPNEVDFLNKKKCTDWRFVYQTINLLKDDTNSKAVIFMPAGPLFQLLNVQQAAREYFIKSGWIQSIIALPSKLMAPATAISLYCMVLSKGNKSIKMIDARQFYEKERRKNILTDLNIDMILSLKENPKFSKEITFGELNNNAFSLLPEDYLTPINKFKNSIPFKDVICSITRGASISATQLDEMSSLEETDCQYLQLGNIKGGIIDNNLPYIHLPENKFKKYFIENGNLIMSKNGAPFKVAVADFDKTKRVLGCGNLYIIKVDESIVLPEYIKIFFESNIGISILKNKSKGVTIPSISVKDLGEIPIPLLSMEKQKQLIEQYLEIEDEIKVLRMRLDDADKRRKNVITFDSIE